MQKITDKGKKRRREKQKWRQNGEGTMQEWEHGRTENRKKKGSRAKGEQVMEKFERCGPGVFTAEGTSLHECELPVPQL